MGTPLKEYLSLETVSSNTSDIGKARELKGELGRIQTVEAMAEKAWPFAAISCRASPYIYVRLRLVTIRDRTNDKLCK
jgi:hypothetical protein